MNRDVRRLQNIKEASVASGDTKGVASHAPSNQSMKEGEQVFAQEGNKPLALYKKDKGALWKVALSSNGNQYVEKDLNISGNLIIGKNREEKHQPSFLAYNSSTDINFSIGSYADVEFDSEVFDVGDNFASNVFTAPATGKYFFHTSVGINTIDIDATYYTIQLVTSNRNYHTVLDPNFASDTATGTPSHLFQITCVADMEAADTAKVQAKQVGGAAISDIIGGGSSDMYTWFNGYLLG